MSEPLPRRPTGSRLSPEDYLEDFYPRFWAIDRHDFWKLERIQSFRESGSASWDAFTRGDWEESLALIRARRDDLREYYDRVARSGFVTYRVRVVEEEISPYLQWQLHSLVQRNQLGERIRIVGGRHVSRFEPRGILPEIVTVGSSAVYEVLYDDSGSLSGAILSERSSDVESWRDFIRGLYEVGEDVEAFFARRVAPLDPPRVA
ncbi:DUF6879 family protein [Allokutzneria albata]|uniref:DUF6879 domain-containing protein n=1 Tax=Allokutzneria albata TaxID=211114 RepID=A0A1G9WHJ7_ALLAB|nr:DUF6879 family protein [Allokutzneria albata]SDM84042.1 hypothetical protein SAMN04489726_3621 [Allokutzneria albata]